MRSVLLGRAILLMTVLLPDILTDISVVEMQFLWRLMVGNVRGTRQNGMECFEV